jgi:hypothetical protein
MILLINYALKIAIRFAAIRKQFGDPKSNEELPLLEYRLH